MGDRVAFEIVLQKSHLDLFRQLTGDNSRLHRDEKFAQELGFDGLVPHGLLLASYFSRLVGMHFLADNNLYLSQSLNFRQPAHLGEKLIVTGVIKNKIDAVRTVEIITIISDSRGQELITGTATVKYLP